MFRPEGEVDRSLVDVSGHGPVPLIDVVFLTLDQVYVLTTSDVNLERLCFFDLSISDVEGFLLGLHKFILLEFVEGSIEEASNRLGAVSAGDHNDLC